jgi:hypothetical protein
MTTSSSEHSPYDWLKTALVMIMTMRENDAERWDPDELVAFAKSMSVDALGFSVGGITAFYPTDIPLHPRSPSLNGRDLVGETVAALKGAGMRAVARIDASLAGKAIAAERPEWFAVDAAGKPISVHGHYVACPNSGYYREFMMDVVGEILDRYDFDGLWANAAQFSPWHTETCHCAACRKRFRDETEKEMPREDWADPLWRQYNELRYRWVAEWNREIRQKIQHHRPDCAWLPLSQVVESWDHARRGGWDVDYTEPYEDGLVLEAQRRYTNLWWPGVEARYISKLAPEKASCVTVSYFFPWWRFYAVPKAENRIWTAQIAAHGARPWLHVTGFFSDHFDRRGLQPMRETFAHLAANRDAYENLQSLAEVAIIYSRYSQDNIDGSDPEAAYIDHFRGAYNALLDQRIPFDVLSDKRVTAESLKRYKAVLLPNGACLEDAAIEALTSYVKQGGHLVASFEAGTRTTLGARRNSSFIHDMLNLQDTGSVRRDLKAAYGRVVDPSSPLLEGVGDTDLIPIAGDIVFARGDAATAESLAYVPPVEGEIGAGISVPEFNAIDRVSDYSLAMHRKIGEGSIVYFPWQIELSAYRYGLPDLFHLIGNAVRLAPAYRPQVTVEGPGLIDLSLKANGERVVLSLVNFSAAGSFNSGHRRVVSSLVPLKDIAIRLKLPEEFKAVKHARLAVAGEVLDVSCNDGEVAISLAELREFESIVLDVA